MANKHSKIFISALVLAKNEQEMIGDCLKQLNFADEIIVLDQNSKDETIRIAKQYTDKIFQSESENFSKNRELLARCAKGEWLLYIDADERLGETNILEIKAAIKKAGFSAYYFPRKNYVLGKIINHGGWWPDYVPRLIRKSSLSGWFGQVHESPKIKGEFGYLKNPIVHLSARNMDIMFNKSIKWAKVEAQLYYNANYKPVTSLRVIKACTREFVKRYFIKFGILDGAVGLLEAIYQSLHQAMVHVYLWEIQNKTEEKFKNTTGK